MDITIPVLAVLAATSFIALLSRKSAQKSNLYAIVFMFLGCFSLGKGLLLVYDDVNDVDRVTKFIVTVYAILHVTNLIGFVILSTQILRRGWPGRIVE